MNIQHMPARTLYGIEIRSSDVMRKDIAALWNWVRFENIADDIPERADDKLVVAYHSYEGDSTQPYTYFLGCEVIDIACVPDGFVLRELPAGDYAAFTTQGEMPQALIDSWESIRKSGLRRSYALDFEIHDMDTPDKVEIYVGVH